MNEQRNILFDFNYNLTHLNNNNHDHNNTYIEDYEQIPEPEQSNNTTFIDDYIKQEEQRKPSDESKYEDESRYEDQSKYEDESRYEDELESGDESESEYEDAPEPETNQPFESVKKVSHDDDDGDDDNIVDYKHIDDVRALPISRNHSPFLEYSTIHEARVEECQPLSALFKNKYKHTWVDDSSVTQCTQCHKDFGIFFRKHHCRYCKNIFCSICTPYRRKIPATWDKEDSGVAVRVCRVCNKQIDVLEEIQHLILIFNYAVIDIQTLCRMAQVSKLWHYLASYYQGKIRNIQYKKFGQTLTPFEKDILQTNKHLWIGHSHWSILYLQSLPYHDYNFNNHDYSNLIQFLMSINLSSKHKRKYKCLNLMCSKNCLKTFRPYHAIILLNFAYQQKINVPELYQFIVGIIKQANDVELNLYLPYLVHKLTEHHGVGVTLIAQFLIDRCISNSELALEVYWNLRYCFNINKHHVYDFYIKKLLQHVNHDVVEIINSSYQFVHYLQNIPTTSSGGMTLDKLFRVKKYFRENKLNDLVIPFDSYSRVNYIATHAIEIKNSATCPVFLPINCRRLGEQDNLDCYLLYKLENVHQDYVVLKAIRLMKYLLYSLNGIELEIVDYQVRPIDGKSGIVQMVPDCHTVYEIREKMKFTIFNYITENNPGKTVDYLRKRFVKSCAAYCVITYLLGVGDRHLDNIMITTEGRLFHIDYGFILGSDPKPISQPKIRITQDMIEALGGRNSIYYEEFITLCNDIYQAMRGHLKLFTYFLSILASNNDEYRKLIKVLTSRFIPGETKKTAIVQLEAEIFKSSTHYSAPVIDFFHRHNKENTLKQAGQQISQQVGMLGNQVGKALSGFWNWGTEKNKLSGTKLI